MKAMWFGGYARKPFDGDLDLIKVFTKPYKNDKGEVICNQCILDMNEKWTIHGGYRDIRELIGKWDTFNEDGSRGQVTIYLSAQYSKCLTLKQLKLASQITSPVTEEDEKQFRLVKGSGSEQHFMTLHVTPEGTYK